MAQMLVRGYQGHEHTNNVNSHNIGEQGSRIPSLKKGKDPGE